MPFFRGRYDRGARLPGSGKQLLMKGVGDTVIEKAIKKAREDFSGAIIFGAKFYPETADSPDEWVVFGGCATEQWFDAANRDQAAMNQHVLATYRESDLIDDPPKPEPIEIFWNNDFEKIVEAISTETPIRCNSDMCQEPDRRGTNQLDVDWYRDNGYRYMAEIISANIEAKRQGKEITWELF